MILSPNKWKRRYENEHKIKRELKKQLHEAGLQIQSLIEENMSCPSSCSKIEELKSQKQEWEDLVDKFKNQQKEFIDWLKERIKTLEDKLTKYNELVIQGKETDVEYYLSIIDERELDAYKKVLSKYKEIIGVKDE